ncbi:cation:proton antiporter [Luteibacter aegosomatissinici]|uniref:cation:proton antiporter n=1 Tax=Luteibacter aegosomatissinici TaxID=2911539 RepID=UPI001FF8CCA3|nr:sodium:proton antiporter [Luteibacter aegosomatissinici]UPG96402.1 sodium:proton antiporter [Luteibacter aegosomatissinici]
MALFESMILLSLLAVVLLRLSRHFALPYPTILAAAGTAVAALPWAPHIAMDPKLALVLFIAPVLLDAGFDMPPRTLRRFWLPTVSLAVVAVIFTTAAVAWLGVAWAGMPLAAAVAMGAIVAPPDAGAATAMLSRLNLPRRTVQVLTAESLLNDASALLIFGVAVRTALAPDGLAHTLPMLLLAVPGGLLLGWLLGRVFIYFSRELRGTLSATLLQFAGVFGIWLIAEYLHVSAILCVVSFAMTIAHVLPGETPPRDRVHAYSVWAAVVFISNVIAFLLVGLQARTIVARMAGPALEHALWFAAAALGVCIVVRFAWVMIYNVTLRRFRKSQPNPTPQQGLVVAWCGMRGLVTLATALGLPDAFPQRDLIVLTAFGVTVGTLVFQGTTLAWLVRFLKFGTDTSLRDDASKVRLELIDVAEATLVGESDEAARRVREYYEDSRHEAEAGRSPVAGTRMSELKRKGLQAKRKRLLELRHQGAIEDDVFHLLENELDWSELAVTSPDEREIVEG